MKTTFRKRELNLFWYWINERESIRQAKIAGKPWPWTKDKILQTYKFTNVFRRQDRTTLQLVEQLRARGLTDGDPVKLYNHINTFRLFNRDDTYGAISQEIDTGNWAGIERVLRKRKNEGAKLWTGAYMMSAAAAKGTDKLHDYILTAKAMWSESEIVVHQINKANSLEYATQHLQIYNHVGSFVAYELACDYSYFKPLLGKCTDRYTWANTGPGAARGIHRLMTGSHEKPFNGIDYVKYMHDLMLLSYESDTLDRHVPKLEMRDIEHSLCEFDKYMRVKNDEGRTPKQKYRRPE